jgi:fibronectin type 3 domain-containing protein
MGMAYKDNNVNEGGQYYYMVKTIKNGKEIIVDSSEVIQQGPWEADRPIAKIKAERKRKEVDFKFTVEHHRYYSLDYERKPNGASKFVARNKAPVLIQRDENGNYPDVVFSDKPIHKDTAYAYLVYGVNYFGKRTKPSSEIFVAKKDFDPPKPVIDVQYDQDTLDVKLTWKPSPEKDDDLKGFHVYRSLFYDKDYEKVTPAVIPVNSTEYIDKVPQPGDYYYMIVAVDKSDNESGSAAIMADIRDVVAPKTPVGFKAVADSGKVKLSWNDNTEKDLKGYLLFKSLAGKNVFVQINGDPIKSNRYEEKLPKQVKNRFVYKLIAVDSAYNRSKYSDSVSIKLPDLFAPAVPIIKDIVADKSVKIKWLQSVDNDLASYSIYRLDTKSKDKNPVVIAEKVKPSESEFADLTAVKNASYIYYLLSVDSTGNKSQLSNGYPFTWVDTKSGLVIKDFDVKLNAKDKKARVTWKAEIDKQFKGFIVFRSFNGGEVIQLSGNLDNPETDEFIDSKLKEGTYTYFLKLYDKLGNIVKSSEVRVTLAPEKN